jgi:simple sugar transport system permease protein
MKTFGRRLVRFLLATKLFWGLAVLYAVGVLSSPVNRRGINIFLSPGNQSDVLRQVSNNGIIAVGMTLVILTGGIDLSVGSLMALGSVLCAMLLTLSGWTNASVLAIPLLSLVLLLLGAYAVPLLAVNLRHRSARPVDRASRNVRLAGWAVGAVLAFLAWFWTKGQLATKFGVLGVLVTVPAARLLGGPSAAIFPVYSGSNATEQFDVLRALVFQVIPVPGLFFLAAVLLFGFLLRFSIFGRYVYAIGGNEQAARLAGIHVDQVKIAVYALSGFLSALAGVLYTAQYRQGKPDAGTGAELDAIAAVVIGGTNLMGGRGTMLGTLVGVLIFGFLGNILLLRNIDSNTQLVLKGVIILAAVLLQEGQINFWHQHWIRTLRGEPKPAGSMPQATGSTTSASVPKA